MMTKGCRGRLPALPRTTYALPCARIAARPQTRARPYSARASSAQTQTPRQM
ncbi:hypothetical protein SBADM41S_07439 [Streptomyces badius]